MTEWEDQFPEKKKILKTSVKNFYVYGGQGKTDEIFLKYLGRIVFKSIIYVHFSKHIKNDPASNLLNKRKYEDQTQQKIKKADQNCKRYIESYLAST